MTELQRTVEGWRPEGGSIAVILVDGSKVILTAKDIREMAIALSLVLSIEPRP